MSRLEQERTTLQQQLEWMEVEVKEKTDQIMDIRKEKVGVIVRVYFPFQDLSCGTCLRAAMLYYKGFWFEVIYADIYHASIILFD